MYKKILFIFFITIATLCAQENSSLVQKAVFDCSAKELSFIASRLNLIERTSNDFTKLGAKSDFVLTIHSHCTPIVSKEALTYYTPNNKKLIENIHKQLAKLMFTYYVDIRVCDIALNAFGIEKEELIEGVSITPNSFVDVISLQNQGYALFPLMQ